MSAQAPREPRAGPAALAAQRGQLRPEVGAWVGVLSHPGNQLFTFTQGTVTRYSRNKTDDAKTER